MAATQQDGVSFWLEEYSVRTNLSDVVSAVNKDVTLTFSAKRVAMGSCPGCGGQFRGDPGIRERDFIIARGSHLIIMGERETLRNIFPHEREEKEISKIGTTGPAQVSVREPENGRIAGMVA